MKLKDITVCPACGSSNIVHDEADEQIVCHDCLEVFSELTPEMEKRYEEASDII